MPTSSRLSRQRGRLTRAIGGDGGAAGAEGPAARARLAGGANDIANPSNENDWPAGHYAT